MSTMKAAWAVAPFEVDVLDLERPVAGPWDVLVRIRACGICGTDTFFVRHGGAPIRPDAVLPVALGDEPAGEVVEVGSDVVGLAVGDRVVVNPMAAPSGLIGNGGPLGAMRDYLLIEDAMVGTNVAVFPDTVPFEVAALNQPIAVARHWVNRSGATETDKVIVFGAGPIGLGVTIWLKLRGVKHVIVVDGIPERLEKALSVGADAVIDSRREDVQARLLELHGAATDALGAVRAETDIYIDAVGASAVLDVALASAKWGAKFVMVAVQKGIPSSDLTGMLQSEMILIASMGYPDEVFQVTPEIAEHWPLFARLISHRVPFSEVERAFDLALMPGAAEKVVVTFGDPA